MRRTHDEHPRQPVEARQCDICGEYSGCGEDGQLLSATRCSSMALREGAHVYDLGYTSVDELPTEEIQNVRRFKGHRVEYGAFSYSGQFNNLTQVGVSLVEKFQTLGIGFNTQAFLQHTSNGERYIEESVEWEFDPPTSIKIRIFQVGLHCHRHTIDRRGHGIPNGQESFYFLVKINPLTL